VNTCGKLTKGGRPCKQWIGPQDIACSMHITPQELELRDAIKAADDAGFARGKASAESHLEMKRLNLEFEVERRVKAELQNRSCIHVRQVDDEGRQLFTAAFGSSGSGYAYSWCGPGLLKVGDQVLVPPGYYMPRGTPRQAATVISLGTDYSGNITSISQRAEHTAEAVIA